MHQSLLRWLSVAVLVGGSLSLSSTACAQLPPEPLVVEELPSPPKPHWIWITDFTFSNLTDTRALLVDGDTGRLLGMLTTGYSLTAVLSPKSADVIYAPEAYFARGTRGKRTDVVTIYDAASLLPVGEIAIPPKRPSITPMLAAQALTDDDRFLLIYNFTPAQSVTVVDTRARKFLGEIETAGCALIYPTGPRSFFSICGDGALLVTTLTDAGKVASSTRTAAVFDVLKDPLTEKGVRFGETWLFASFEGEMHPLRNTPAGVQADPTWPLFTTEELAQHWRTGGLQHLALHRASGRLFAIVHQGGPETHKDDGGEIWVYDLASHRNVQRIVARKKVGSIQVSQDAQPLLFACSPENKWLDVYDATSGKHLRTVDDLAQTPTALVNP